MGVHGFLGVGRAWASDEETSPGSTFLMSLARLSLGEPSPKQVILLAALRQ